MPYTLIQTFLKTNFNNNKPLLIAIIGPTASGKTALSLKVAEKFNGEIISADSRQIYREMDISTDKIMEKNRRNIPHYMIDIANPNEIITVASFKEMVDLKIKEISKKGKLPILIGGTGLYFESIIENYQIPKTDPNSEVRENLEKELIEKGQDYMYKKLQELDPDSAKKIDPRNHRYLTSALQINLETGMNKKDLKGERKYNVLKIGINWNREKLYERINKRVDLQIERGLIEETKKMLEKYDKKLPSMTSLGYPQIGKYINGELTLEEAKTLLQKQTRDYARRQLTWFRRDKEINWLDGQNL